MTYEINETTDLAALTEKIKQEPNPSEVVKLYAPVLSFLSKLPKSNKELREKCNEFHLSVNMLVVDACYLKGKFSNSEAHFEEMYKDQFSSFAADNIDLNTYNVHIGIKASRSPFDTDGFKAYAEWVTNNKS